MIEQCWKGRILTSHIRHRTARKSWGLSFYDWPLPHGSAAWLLPFLDRWVTFSSIFLRLQPRWAAKVPKPFEVQNPHYKNHQDVRLKSNDVRWKRMIATHLFWGRPGGTLLARRGPSSSPKLFWRRPDIRSRIWARDRRSSCKRASSMSKLDISFAFWRTGRGEDRVKWMSKACQEPKKPTSSIPKTDSPFAPWSFPYSSIYWNSFRVLIMYTFSLWKKKGGHVSVY